MELFHTSANKIEKITTSGRYGQFLCFSENIYEMSACETVGYKIDIEDEKIIDAGDLFYAENSNEILSGLIADVCEMAHVDSDTATELIDGSESIWNLDVDIDNEDKAEIDWDIQHISAKAAKLLGYRGVSVRDEQGTCYMIDMLGFENELQEVAE